MTIIPYSNQYKTALAGRMNDYMTELNCNVPEEIIHGELSDLIDHQCQQKIIHVDLVMIEQTIAGFSVYQLDTPESDWCKRPGWGFIREFYVVPQFRKLGIGKLLAAHTESALRTLGAAHLYLTSTDGVPFWQCCGWHLTEELCSNDQYILEK